MPGIVGLITKMPRERAEEDLLAMVDSMRHEPMYRTGVWIDEQVGVYAGWSVREGSFADLMPVCNETGNKVLVFSGEEFSRPDTEQRLRQDGHDVGMTAASYLVHLAEEADSFPANLNGRFHGLLVDRLAGTALLFNDRYGMSRIYYCETANAFYFAAEAKAILAICPAARSIDPRGMGEFISCGCVLENRSLFRGVEVLPPSSAWRFQRAELRHRDSYFRPQEWEDQPTLSPEAYYRELQDVFARVLPRYFSGQERISVSLTGGLDTRMIMAWHKANPRSLPCFSFGSLYRENQDVAIGRRVAQLCEQDHQVIEVGEEFLTQFPNYAERTVMLADGCADVSHSPDLYVNERMRQIAPVRMTGNYGGEVLRRVRAFKPMEVPIGLFRPEVMAQVDVARQTYSGLLNCHALSFAVFRQAPWHHYGLLALEQTQVTTRSPYLDNEFVRTVFRAPASACENNDVCLRLIAEGDARLAGLRTDRGLGGNRNALSAAILRQYLEFTFKSEYAYDYGMPQAVAKIDHLFAPVHFERLFLGRHKFYHFRVWYRDNLAGYIREILLDNRTVNRPYLNANALESIVRSHLKGDHNYTTAIHKLLTLELIHRVFIDSSSSRRQGYENVAARPVAVH